jgi:KDO2-lipid IV(A) lauroyltransferase
MNFLVKLVASLWFFFDKRRKKVIYTNLDLVYPDMSDGEKTKFAKKIFENVVFNLFELIKNRGISKEKLSQKVEFVGLDKVKKYFDKPVVFISAHYGNWEMMPLILGGLLEIPMTVVVRNLDNKFLNNFFKTNRERFNIETIDKKGALKGLMKAIKEGRSVGIFVDQNTAKSEGLDVEMFGLKALHTPSAALLAKKFDVPIIPVFIQREGKNYKIIFKEPILEKDVQKSVQLQSKVIEEMIKEKPEEWYWLHRRFKHYYEEKYD